MASFKPYEECCSRIALMRLQTWLLIQRSTIDLIPRAMLASHHDVSSLALLLPPSDPRRVSRDTAEISATPSRKLIRILHRLLPIATVSWPASMLPCLQRVSSGEISWN